MATKKVELLADVMRLGDREHHRGDEVELDTERADELAELGMVGPLGGIAKQKAEQEKAEQGDTEPEPEPGPARKR